MGAVATTMPILPCLVEAGNGQAIVITYDPVALSVSARMGLECAPFVVDVAKSRNRRDPELGGVGLNVSRGVF